MPSLRPPRRLACAGLAILLLAVPLAGCLGSTGGGPDPAAAPEASGNASSSTRNGSPVSTAHVHDRWDGQTERVIFDGTVSTQTTANPQPGQGLFGNLFCILFACPATASFTPDEIVPPGTDNLTVRASWDDDPGSKPDVGFGYRAANMSEVQVVGQYTESPIDATIDVTTEMADGGHAQKSLWSFAFVAWQADLPDGAPIPFVPRHGVQPLEIDVEVVAHRVDGELPEEPPHPDWWEDGPRTIYRTNGSGQAVQWSAVEGNVTGDTPEETVNGSAHGLVPPGTRSLVVNVTWANDAPTEAATGGRPYVFWTDTFLLDQGLSELEPARLEDGHAVFVLPVSEEMTDGMYADRSRWLFLWKFEGEDTGQPDPLFGTPMGRPYLMDGSWSVTMTVHNGTELPGGIG